MFGWAGSGVSHVDVGEGGAGIGPWGSGAVGAYSAAPESTPDMLHNSRTTTEASSPTPGKRADFRVRRKWTPRECRPAGRRFRWRRGWGTRRIEGFGKFHPPVVGPISARHRDGGESGEVEAFGTVTIP